MKQAAFLTIAKNRTFQVLIAIVAYITLAPSLPTPAHQGLYTISLFIKDLLLWILPLTICFFISYAIVSFEKKAPLFILALFSFEAISNATSVWYAYACGHFAISHIHPIEPQAIAESFSPLWRMPLVKPSWWSADKGTFAGIVIGLMSVFFSSSLKNFVNRGKNIVEKILTRFFSRLIPIFVLGFVARMHHTHLLQQMMSQYADLLLFLFVILSLYIAFLFFLGKGPLTPSFLKRVQNLLPATSIAFSSGCSLSTMPWTIEGTSKNLNDPDLAKAIIPATTNIQQIGDCIVNSFLCFVIYTLFFGMVPDLSTWTLFSLVFVLARFATAAVLGGAIFIMLPIYESYLGFTPEMIAIILGFNVILDPFVTSSNVIANGALCRLFEKTWGFIQRKRKPLIQKA